MKRNRPSTSAAQSEPKPQRQLKVRDFTNKSSIINPPKHTTPPKGQNRRVAMKCENEVQKNKINKYLRVIKAFKYNENVDIF